MPNGSDRITTHNLQELQPTKTVDDPEIKGWLSLGTKTKKKGGGKKKKGWLEIKYQNCLSIISKNIYGSFGHDDHIQSRKINILRQL